jgi:hypothetical protein
MPEEPARKKQDVNITFAIDSADVFLCLLALFLFLAVVDKAGLGYLFTEVTIVYSKSDKTVSIPQPDGGGKRI